MSRHFIGRLLIQNVSSRYTSEIALKHPWITRDFLGAMPKTYLEDLKSNKETEKARRMLGSAIFLYLFKVSQRRKSSDRSLGSKLKYENWTDEVSKTSFLYFKEKPAKQTDDGVKMWKNLDK